MFDKTCHKCGSFNNYKTIMKNNQNTAWCNDCNSFMGNEPYSNQKPVLYFGKYKGKLIEDFESPEEIKYLQWVKNTPDLWDNLKSNVQAAIERKVY